MGVEQLAEENWRLKYYFIYKYRHRFYIPMDELESISHEAMAKTVIDYDPDKGSFSTLYGKIFSDMCRVYINKHSNTRKRGDADEKYLEDMVYESEGKNQRTWEEIFGGFDPDPENVVIKRDQLERVVDYLEDRLGRTGKKVLHDYLLGEKADSAAEYGRQLGVSDSSITYQIRRIRNLANGWEVCEG